MAIEDIAQDEPSTGPVAESLVNQSIQIVLAWQQANSLAIVTPSAHEVILKHISTVDEIIGEFATATKTRTIQVPRTRLDGDNEITVTRKLDGKDIPVFDTIEVVEIDYNTRGRVIEHLKALRDMVASKETKLINDNRTQTATTNIYGTSFEQKIHKKLEARGLKHDEDTEEIEQIQDAEFDEELEEDEEEVADESSS